MIPEIREMQTRTIIGRNLLLPLYSREVFALWKEFRTEQMKAGLIDVELYSIQEFAEWPPKTTIMHWSGIEKQDTVKYPEEWQECVLQGGAYAFALFKGDSEEFPAMLKDIIVSWIPTTDYEYDPSRLQFQVMPHDYKLDDPNAEEQVWIPVRTRGEDISN